MNKQNQDKVLTFLQNKPHAKVDDICIGTKLSYITVVSALKGLASDEKVATENKGGVITYSLTENGAEETLAAETEKAENPAEETPEVTKASKSSAKTAPKKPAGKTAKKKEEEELGPKTYTGRDNTRYRFGEHRNLAKGRLALLLVRTYAEKNPKVSLSKLQELFHSSEIHPRFQVVDEVSKAKKFSQGDRHRFFLNADDVFK